jgi:hypothetical protein
MKELPSFEKSASIAALYSQNSKDLNIFAD